MLSRRGALGHASRALLVLVLVGGAVLIGRLALAEQLSEVRLINAIADAAGQVSSFARPLLRSPVVPPTLIFCAGVSVGWIAARLWTSRRSRRLPLIIADLRHANVSFADAVAHVRRYATAPVEDDAAAIWLILQQASRGRLTIWRRAAANTLWRVSSRQVHAMARRIVDLPAESLPGERWNGFMLLASELERSWPSRIRQGATWQAQGEQAAPAWVD